MSGQVSDLNLQLIQEQRMRLALEERLRSMEMQVATTPAVTSANVVTLNPIPISRIPVSIDSLATQFRERIIVHIRRNACSNIGGRVGSHIGVIIHRSGAYDSIIEANSHCYYSMKY